VVAEKHPEAQVLAPLFRGGDWLGASLAGLSSQPNGRGARLAVERNASPESFSEAVERLAAVSEFAPAWSDTHIRWLLAHAERKERHGPAHRTVVRDPKGEPAGCYLYHGKPGGLARVLQILARPRDTEVVVDALLDEADATGLAALRGRINPQLMNILLKRKCLFLHRASTVIHSADVGLVQAIEADGALLNGLAGETWTRLIGGEFV
jgi:hypothetical protein